MIWTPRATVATVVEKDQTFLTVSEQVKGELVFNQPAGHIEANERIVEAAIRETFEETGWEVKPSYLLGVYIYRPPANDLTFHRYCFIAEPVHHHPDHVIDPDIEATHWLTLEQLSHPNIHLRSPLVVQCIKDYLAGIRYPLAVIHEDE
ncbi:NUDIX hydrolase [Spartinivicinus ruber]|uniref:NUDIX hydrolase n=1 Tax=Spartinivicinus ruber TaxID=2683272 RepID=UPI0013D7BFC9|nr:NUDIX hydrolase [Spartinivicinus ruber]